jgi:hypothetical protein
MAEHARGPEAEDDRVPGGRVIGGLAFAIVFGGLLVLLSWLLLESRSRALRPSGHFPERALGAPRTVEGVRQGVFELERTGADEQDEARARLERFEWVDRRRRLVAIPIDAAIDLVATEGR